jgi:hypothetical protein
MLEAVSGCTEIFQPPTCVFETKRAGTGTGFALYWLFRITWTPVIGATSS